AVNNVSEVRRFIKTIQGFKSVTIIERENNYGLSKSIIDGVNTLVDRFGKVIVVEDDLETSPFFLRFMNDGLSFYETDDRVISIHGYVYPVKGALPTSFFLKGADCWGWATWKRSWDLYVNDGTALLERLKRANAEYQFDFNGSYPYTRMLKQQIKGKNDSWAVRWYASAFLNEKLTLYPGRSLVNNISSDHLGTHTKQLTAFQSQLSTEKIPIETIPVEDNAAARSLFEAFFRSIRVPFYKKIFSHIRSLLG
ncbi:MAG: glycosyltransferase family 2 protein, partial [Bacteroidota bacterium]